MMRLLNTHLCLLSFLLGCVEESTFNTDYSMLVCDKLVTCAPGAIETGFGDQDSCELDVQERLDVLRDDPGCRFDAEAATDCLAQTDRLSCEVWLMYGEPDACEQGYICSEDSGASTLTDGSDG